MLSGKSPYIKSQCNISTNKQIPHSLHIYFFLERVSICRALKTDDTEGSSKENSYIFVRLAYGRSPKFGCDLRGQRENAL